MAHLEEFTQDEEHRLVAGYPKTGRTWVRYMLASALVEHYDLDLDVNLNNVYNIVPNDEAGRVPGQPAYAYDGTVPKIEMTHQRYVESEHQYVMKIFLMRDPRDIMVSHWLHNQNQRHQFDGTLSDFIHDSKFGIDAFLDHLSSWAPKLNTKDVVTYENMRSNPVGALKRIIDTLKVPISASEAAAAVSASSMDNMRQKEIQHGIAGHVYDKANPEALRVRRGKVGGFVDYMLPQDEEYIHERIASSEPPTKAVIDLTAYQDTTIR